MMYRLFKRRLQYIRSISKDMPSDWHEKLVRDFLLFVWRFNRNSRYKITDAIVANPDKKVVMLQTSQEATKYLEGVQ